MMRLFCCFFFFFSSRRRHTRCLSDWSSDVCSSDLIRCMTPSRKVSSQPGTSSTPKSSEPPGNPSAASTRLPRRRSEERRVGKEWRSRWSPDQQKKADKKKKKGEHHERNSTTATQER